MALYSTRNVLSDAGVKGVVRTVYNVDVPHDYSSVELWPFGAALGALASSLGSARDDPELAEGSLACSGPLLDTEKPLHS